MAKVSADVSDVIDSYSGLSRRVLDYVLHIKGLFDRSKKSDFSAESWNELANFVDERAFTRVGNFKEVMGYQQYVDFLSKWGPSAHWDGSFKRITEHDDVVILELEERITSGDLTHAINSVTIYEFNQSGKVRHLDVYLQAAPKGAELDPAYS